MNNQNEKIQFLLRLNAYIALFPELYALLIDEKIQVSASMKDFARAVPMTQAQELYLALTSDKLMLVDWEWTILPKEYMKLTVVTHNGVKEFIYGL